MTKRVSFNMSEAVTIGICTFRRPALFDALASFAQLVDHEKYDLRIVIADNDTTDQLRSTVEEFATSYPFPIRYVHAPAQNISIARNAVLDAVETPWLLFIDDDETADRNWLKEIMHNAQNYDAVIGACIATYDDSLPGWLKRCDFHSNVITGKVENAYTSNALLRMEFVRKHNLRFRVELGRTGGEDTVFFHQLSGLGGRMAYRETAIVWEAVLPARANMQWVKTRMYRAGQTHGLVTQEFAPDAYRSLFFTAGAKASFSAVMSILTLPGTDASRKWWARSLLHVGAAQYRLNPAIMEEYG